MITVLYASMVLEMCSSIHHVSSYGDKELYVKYVPIKHPMFIIYDSFIQIYYIYVYIYMITLFIILHRRMVIQS